MTEAQRAELRPEIAELRAARKSWKIIGATVGCSRSMAQRIHAGEEAYNAKAIKRRRLAQERAKGKTQAQAAEVVGMSQQWANTQEQDPRYRKMLTTILDKAGVTDERLAEKHNSLLDANRQDVQLKAVELGYKMRGHTEALTRDDGPMRAQTVIQINYHAAEMLKGLSGGVLPPVIEVLPEEALAEDVETVPAVIPDAVHAEGGGQESRPDVGGG